MDAALKKQLRGRAGNRCEYCRLCQEHELARPFHVEHIIPVRHKGSDDFENLALACRQCNLMKGPCIASLDPDGRGLTRLFHPRQDLWDDHFRWDGALIVGNTSVGRTTIWFLNMNAPNRLRLRTLLLEAGELD